MKPLLMQCVFWGLLFILQWGGHECCLKEERVALLQIKAFFTTGVNVVVAHRFLPSWLEKGDNDTADCCTWERVICNPITGRVTKLSLDHLIKNCNSFSGLSLDVSLFSPFEELVNLQLSGNCFSCCVHNQGFDKLKRVEGLNLAENDFGDNIFRSLGALTTLTSLNLSWNSIYGRRGGLQDLTMLKNLKVLDLSANYVEGSIPLAIGNLTTLVALSLAENNLIGTLPNQEFCKLRNLEELDLSLNYGLDGVLPPCFTNLTFLRLLDLSTNNFKGEISFIFPNLRSLEYIRLGDNHFEGKFSFSLLANHSKVTLVEILNNDNLEVESEDSNWVPEFQLEVLVLSDCNLNKQSPMVPTFLAYQSMLKVLDLSHNNLRGGFPDWVIKNNSQLQVLRLSNNSLEGQLHFQPHLNTTSILWMDVSENQLRGRLEENLGRKLPYMTTLNLSRNHFEGFVPSSFCNMSGLVQLDLSNNFFDGEIAKEMVSGCLNSLEVLILSGNRFHGQIFSTDFNMTLSVLHLEDNQFSGTITNAISTSYLVLLDASNNHFSGELHWISNMTYLITLLIQNNSLTGRFPCKIPGLNHLDVSHNSLSGALLPCKYEINHLLLHSNKFTGPIPETLLHWPLLTLNIRDNNLSGNIPSVTRAESLRVLLLGGNQLNGSFPNQLCSLQKISLLDLSHNNFFGEIPQCISNITFGKTRYADFNHDDVSVFIGSKVVTFGNFLVKQYEIVPRLVEYYEQVTVDFVVKKRSNSYKGDILKYMSGLDLSCNNFTGEIPYELGELELILALNLSRNQIKGPIPASFSGLRQLESLDLSYNNLTGKIPPELIDLNFLAFFSVAYNNLSGRVPDMKGQFGTFDESSYEGNPYLCGELLANKCNKIIEPNPPTPPSELTSEAKWYEIDMLIFWVAFIVAFIIFFLGVVISLYVNPYWSRRLWNFVDDCYYACYFKFCM